MQFLVEQSLLESGFLTPLIKLKRNGNDARVADRRGLWI